MSSNAWSPLFFLFFLVFEEIGTGAAGLLPFLYVGEVTVLYALSWFRPSPFSGVAPLAADLPIYELAPTLTGGRHPHAKSALPKPQKTKTPNTLQ